MIAPGTGAEPVFIPAARAFHIHCFAFPLHVTFLFIATYAVQFPQANPRVEPVFFTAYRAFIPEPSEEETVAFCLFSVGFTVFVEAVSFDTLGALRASVSSTSRAAPGIIRSTPSRILAASLRLFTRMISSIFTEYRPAICERVSPDFTI